MICKRVRTRNKEEERERKKGVRKKTRCTKWRTIETDQEGQRKRD